MNIAMGNHHFLWDNSPFQWPFSIAMLNYRYMDDIDLVVNESDVRPFFTVITPAFGRTALRWPR